MAPKGDRCWGHFTRLNCFEEREREEEREGRERGGVRGGWKAEKDQVATEENVHDGMGP